MIRFIFDLIRKLFFNPHTKVPRYVIRPARLLFDAGIGLAVAFLGRQGSGKSYAAAVEAVELMKAHPDQSFFLSDWSGDFINIVLLLILSDPKRDELIPRLVYDAMGGRTINGKQYIVPKPGFSPRYDPEKPWLTRVEDQVDQVQRVFEALNEELILRNPTLGGRPIKSLLQNVLLLVNAISDEKGDTWQITEATRLLNKEFRELALKHFGYKVKKSTRVL